MGTTMTPPPLVSIATPVYNGEKFIAECIESVLRQTYSNWEYLIVNNCSTDGTLQIAESYALSEPRITIHDNRRFREGTANINHMLRMIPTASKYCKMLMADDWMFPTCLDEMVAVAEENPAVGMVGCYKLAGQKVKCDGLPYTTTVVQGREMCRMNLMDGPYTFGSPSAHLIRSGIVHDRDPFYDDGHTSTDTDACLEVLGDYDFGFVHQVLVYVRSHDESVTSQHAWLDNRWTNHICLLVKHGPKYLSAEELEERLRAMLSGYYRVLGGRLFRGPGAGYWDFQKEALARAGRRLSWSSVVRGSVHVALRKAVAWVGRSI